METQWRQKSKKLRPIQPNPEEKNQTRMEKCSMNRVTIYSFK